jgi:hypothetical protein
VTSYKPATTSLPPLNVPVPRVVALPVTWRVGTVGGGTVVGATVVGATVVVAGRAVVVVATVVSVAAVGVLLLEPPEAAAAAAMPTTNAATIAVNQIFGVRLPGRRQTRNRLTGRQKRSATMMNHHW